MNSYVSFLRPVLNGVFCQRGRSILDTFSCCSFILLCIFVRASAKSEAWEAQREDAHAQLSYLFRIKFKQRTLPQSTVLDMRQ